MTQKTFAPPAFPQQLPKTQQEWQNFLNQLQQAVIPQTLTCYKSTTTSSSSITSVLEPELFLPVSPGLYSFDAMLFVNTLGASGNTPGLSLAISLQGSISSSSGASAAYFGNMNGGLSGTFPLNTSVGFPLVTGANISSNVLRVSGSFTSLSNSDIIVIFSQLNASASAVNMNPGSILSVTRLN